MSGETRDGQEAYEALVEYIQKAPPEIRSAWESYDSLFDIQHRQLLRTRSELAKEKKRVRQLEQKVKDAEDQTVRYIERLHKAEGRKPTPPQPEQA